MNNILIDLEGLGTRPGCAVLEIGAIAFDLVTGATGKQFHCHVRPAPPFTATLETLDWHRERGTVIQQPKSLAPREAVLRFLDWLDDHVPGPPDERVFWSWGATYDFPVFEPLLDLRSPEDDHPWKYWQIRDARTIWKLAFGELRHPDRPHLALEDARCAIADLVAAYRELRFGQIQPLIDGLESIRDMFGGESEDPERDLARMQDIAGDVLSKVLGKEAA